jgi:hypothetical protein
VPELARGPLQHHQERTEPELPQEHQPTEWLGLVQLQAMAKVRQRLAERLSLPWFFEPSTSKPCVLSYFSFSSEQLFQPELPQLSVPQQR